MTNKNYFKNRMKSQYLLFRSYSQNEILKHKVLIAVIFVFMINISDVEKLISFCTDAGWIKSVSEHIFKLGISVHIASYNFPFLQDEIFCFIKNCSL